MFQSVTKNVTNVYKLITTQGLPMAGDWKEGERGSVPSCPNGLGLAPLSWR